MNSRRLLQEKFSKQPQTFPQMLATNPMDKEMLAREMDIIERHLDDTDFNVNIFAREMGMARTNLFTKLKEMCIRDRYNINSTGVEQSKAAYAQVLASIPDIAQRCV